MKPPNLLLGTALWGWTISNAICFRLLDEFYDSGFREIDCATNYPIDKKLEDFRLAEALLEEWVKSNGISDLQVLMKIGSINNLGTSQHNLTKSLVLMNLDWYRAQFGENLRTLMIHWDNRNSPSAIQQTLEALEIARKLGLSIGLSGIRHPEIYANLNECFGFDFRIQIKHNILESDYPHYRVFHGKKQFIAYGINAGGIKLAAQDYEEKSALKVRDSYCDKPHPIVPKVRQIIASANLKKGRSTLQSFNHIGMIYAFYSPDIQGILIGPSKIEQLKDSLKFYENLQKEDFSDVFAALINLG